MANTKPQFLIRIAIALCVCCLLAFTTKKADDPIDKLVAALQKWTAASPQEKVYLHLDKPYYTLGDTIWFKGYVTAGSRHQLSAMSGAVYVDLINEQDSVVRNLKLPVTTGMVMGDITLSEGLKEGNYRIRAYTQWMRNAGEDHYFDRTFTVGSVYSDGVITKADHVYKDMDGKSVLTTNLTFADENSKPMADKSVTYRIYIDKKLIYTKATRTDANGNIPVNIVNDKNADLSGAYIRATLTNNTNKEVNKDFPIKAMLTQSDIRFFPEGGDLVTGVVGRVGFKAVGVDGLGLNVSGKVVDNEGKEVISFSSQHAGMGSFTFRPEQGKVYTARVNLPDQSVKTIALPKPTDNGYVLSVYQPSTDSILVRISTTEQQIVQPQTLNLIAQSGGETVFASGIKMDRPMVSVWLDKKAFPSGIAQFTLFNANGDPMNERIAFIKTNDNLQIDIKPNKSSYKSKDQVSLSLLTKDGAGKPTAGNFSVSVIDESKIPSNEADETSIFSSLLLSSDIKGYIEKPNYYFINDDATTNAALDNLMLTQGYRRFKWTELDAMANSKPKFEAEAVGTTISGKVQTLGHKPIYNATVTLLSVRAQVTKFASTDSLGRFKFDGIFMTDSIKFAVQARNAKGKDKVEIILDTIPKMRVNHNPNIWDISTNISGTLKAYIDAGKKQDELNTKIGRMDKVRRLREVNIVGAKKKGNPITNQFIKVPEGLADRAYEFTDEDAEKYPLLGDFLNMKVRGITMLPFRTPLPIEETIPQYPHYAGKAMAIVLNGRKLEPMDAAELFIGANLDVKDVAKVEISTSSAALQMTLNVIKGNTPIPTLLIYTLPFDKKRPGYNPGMVNIMPKGFNTAREFYSPKYDRPGMNKNIPDMRTTIYWNPYLKTYTGGRANINFFNGDGPATYRVTVEGINADGQLGRQVFRYAVGGEIGNDAVLPTTIKDENLRLITNALDTMQKRLPIEKVYLHTDKPYYNMGDTLWFKAYVTDANRNASKLSGLLYVELDDDSAQIVRRVSIPIKDGIGTAQIPLPPTIFQEGGYTLRAYTNWMQNFGDSYFFTQRFYLGVPAQTAWLVKSTAAINQVADKNVLDVDIKLNRGDGRSVALEKVEVKIYEGSRYLYKDQMTTGVDGSLKFSKGLKDKVDGRNLRVQVTGLDDADKGRLVQIPLAINRLQNIDVQFMPEGGHLVSGLRSTVGFKAIGEDGKGTPVAGGIYDSKGAEVVSFTTSHMGMGNFEFTPKPGEKYTARVNQPVTKSFDLPAIAAVGSVMQVVNGEQDSSVTVSFAGLDKLPGDSALYLIGTQAGRMFYSQQVDRNQPVLSIAKEQFPTGVARLTLLKGKRVLNERAVFIDNKDQLNIKLTVNKPSFSKRDSVGLEIEVKDRSGNPVQGNFSLAVTDNSQVKADTIGSNNINTGLLLKADLKGYVEDAGYYLARKDKQAWADLDNLLLTQGWTSYDWKDIFAPAKTPAFRAEKEMIIAGQVRNLGNKPVANAEVLISSQKPNFVTTTTTDMDGRYAFRNLPLIDSGSFFLQANNAKGKARAFGNISVDKIIPAPVPETFRSAVMPWYVNTDSTQINFAKRVAQWKDLSNFKAQGTMLRNVNIKNTKVIKGSFNRSGPGRSDLAFDEKDIKESAVLNLWQLMKQKLPGLKVVSYHGMPTLKLNDRLVVVDIDGGGLPIQLATPPTVDDLIDELSYYQIAQFTGMEVLYSRQYLSRYVKTSQGSLGFNGEQIARSEAYAMGFWIGEDPDDAGKGPFYVAESTFRPGYLEMRANVLTNAPVDIAVVVITTKGGKGWYRNKAPAAVTYRPLPVMHPQQFYSPKYKVNAPVVGLPDYRATIHWEPNIYTDIDGKATVRFYTSDLPSNYTLNLQGITPDGDMGSLIIKLPKIPKAEPQ